MAANDLVDASHPANPCPLPPRYQIRRLTEEDLRAVCAVQCHTNVFHSAVFTAFYPDQLGRRFNAIMVDLEPILLKVLEQNLSYGVFDTEFKYKHESSRARGGEFLWKPDDPPATEAELIDAMDFPLVHTALSVDGKIYPDVVTKEDIASLQKHYPQFGASSKIFEQQDKDPDAHKPQQPGWLVKRIGTSTRRDYERKGLMAGIARWIMREYQLKGFSGVVIDSQADAVSHVWTHPRQKGMKPETIGEYQTQDIEDEDESGNKYKPFGPATQRCSRIWLWLDRDP